jgi:hypothetical protein
MEIIYTLTLIVIFTTLVIWVIGIALALSRWRRHPRVSLFALLALVMMLVSRFLHFSLPLVIRDYDWTEDQIRSVYTAVNAINILINAGAWTLVICAIFGWRDGPQKQNFPPPARPTFDNEPREQNATP